ncbi:MT-A70 family methyltransferase [Azospirillum canadense]|uniref:MT-A70 family methyltransferase n=1 Tax=Azospirillum canadense TaxID=403962 RepID=UPI002227D456|nr:MT-A70 family methyltransferase [Azospirillum canadense]MCW2242204.1 N6-adenosine-specific RNA methylase IME4 [Azospirillum canadense]
MEWPFGNLRPLIYGLIYVDPPWKQAMYSEISGIAKAPQSKYSCMELDAIKALPVGHLAAPNCFIVMWSLWNFVAPGYATDVLKAWGFEPKSGGSWAKITKKGKQAFGTGYGFRGCCEPFLTGAIGRPKVRSKSERNGIITEIEVDAELEMNALLAEIREHSRKPEEMRDALECMFPDVPKVELFSRRPACERWDVWGNETAKFAEAA